MKRFVGLAFGLAMLSVHAQPAPQPQGWPSDLCHASGANASNPLCGTCSTSVLPHFAQIRMNFEVVDLDGLITQSTNQKTRLTIRVKAIMMNR